MKKIIASFLIFLFVFTLCATTSWTQPETQPDKGLIRAQPKKVKSATDKKVNAATAEPILSSPAHPVRSKSPKATAAPLVRTPNGAHKNLVRFRSHQFDPSGGEPPLADDLKIAKYPEREKGFYIVQFKGPIKKAWKQKVRQLGGRLYSYIPDNAFIVKMDSKQRAQVAKLSEVRWVGVYQPAYKISPVLKEKIRVPREKIGIVFEPITITVQLFNDEDTVGISRMLKTWGGQIISASDGKRHEKIRVKIMPSNIVDIANIIGVEWLEEYVRPKLCNDVSMGIMNVPDVWSPGGLTGSGQIVGVCDTGLDVGKNNPSMLDDFEGRIFKVYPLGHPVDWSDDHGHGTHTSGSILGNGAMSGGQFKGAAYEAQLVVQAVKVDEQGYMFGLPLNLYDLFLPPYNDGARIHSDSWGEPVYGEYNISAQEIDEFIWDHPDMCIHFVAGNSGRDADADGVVDLDSLDSPGTAKNCITVGATEGYRLSGGYSDYTYGYAWPDRYPAIPIAGDYMSDDPDGMAAFSSRGPTDDGRIKPDVVSPGTNIISCRSQDSKAGTLWGDYNTYYSFSGGTSMSTPLVAGAATLTRQYYTDIEGLSFVSAALIKATLINGALDISPGQYETGPTQEIPDPPRPNNVEGWGRADLNTSLFPAAPREIDFIDETTGLSTAEGQTYFYGVNDASVPLKVTLVYTDYPGTPSTMGRIVNDLDLTVTDPSNTIFYPNGGSGPDHINNVEGVDIQTPVVGTYKVSIAGTNVPQGPQAYALVVSGGDIFRFSVEIFSDIAYSKEDKLFNRGDEVYMKVTMNQGGNPIIGATVTATLRVSNGAAIEDTVDLIDQLDGTYKNSWLSTGHTADVYLADIGISNPSGSGEAYFHLYPGSGVSSYSLDYNEDGNENYILENKHLIAVYDSVDNTDKLLLYLEQKDTDVSYSFKDISFVNSAGKSEVTSSDREMLFSSFTISGQGEGLSSANINMTVTPADLPEELITYYDDVSDNDLFSVDYNAWIAQQLNSADITKDYVLTKVGMVVQKVEQFTALGYTEPLIVEIRTDDNGLPSNTILTSETVPPEEVPMGLTWFNVEFSNPIVLNQGGSYWLVLRNYDVEWIGYIVYGWWLSYAHTYPGKMAYTQNQGASWTDASASYDMLFAVYGHEVKFDTSFNLNIKMNSQHVDYLIYKLSGFDANLDGAISDLFSAVSGSLGPNVEDDRYHVGDGTDYPVDSLTAGAWTNFSALTDVQKYVAIYDDSNSYDMIVNDNIISWVYFPNADTLNFKDCGTWFETDRGGLRIRYDTAGGTPVNEVEYLLVFTQGDYLVIDNWMSAIAGGTLPSPNFMGPPSDLSVSVVPTGWPIGQVIEGQVSQSGLFTVTNDGSVIETFTLNIEGPSSPSFWTAGSSAGDEVYCLKGLFGGTGNDPTGLFSWDDVIIIGTPSPATSTIFGDPSLTSNGVSVEIGGQRGLWFEFQAPTSTSHGGQEQSITVAVGAQAP